MIFKKKSLYFKSNSASSFN